MFTVFRVTFVLYFFEILNDCRNYFANGFVRTVREIKYDSGFLRMRNTDLKHKDLFGARILS